MSRFNFFLIIFIFFVILAFPATDVWAQFTGADIAAPVVDPVIGGTTVWQYIKDQRGIVVIWRVVLGLVDMVAVGGLLIAAFSNIFRINIKNYQIKEVLPGLIIGIILANLSFFIMRLFIEGAAVVTQGIGIIVSNYISTGDGAVRAIGSDAGSAYVISQYYGQILHGLFAVPNNWTGLIPLVSGIGAGVVFFVTTPATTIGTTILGLLLLLFIGIPLIFTLIIIALLYIRNYALVILFILSPLAFFALGFPPLKSLWQKWWGTFWKWLLMMPTAFALLGLGTVFLFYIQRSTAAASATDRDFGGYLLSNVVGILFGYAAIRLPFSWGSFFGVNLVDKWSKYGLQGAKTLTDQPIKALSAGFAYKNKVGTRADKIIAAQKAVKDASKSRFNVFRQTEGAFLGFKKRQEVAQKAEEKAVRGTWAWGTAAGPEANFRQAMDDNEFIKQMDDIEVIFNSQAKDNLDNLLKSGAKMEDITKWIIGKSPLEVSTNPNLQAISVADRAVLSLALSRMGQLATRKVKTGVWSPGGKLLESIKVTGNTATFNKSEFEKFSHEGYDDSYAEEEKNSSTPPLWKVTQQHNQSRQKVVNTLAAQGVAPQQIASVIDLMSEKQDAGGTGTNLNELSQVSGIALNQLPQEQQALVKANLKEYGQDRQALQRALKQSRGEDLDITAKVAVSIAKNHRPEDIELLQQEARQYVKDLSNASLTTSQLDLPKIQARISEIHPEIQPFVALKDDPDLLRTQLLIAAQRRADALDIAHDSLQMNPKVIGQNIDVAVQRTVNVRHLEDKLLDEATELIDSFETINPQEMKVNKDVTANVGRNIQNIVSYHPDMSQQFMRLDEADKEQFIQRTAAEVTERYADLAQKMKISNPDMPLHMLLAEKQQKDKMALKEVFDPIGKQLTQFMKRQTLVQESGSPTYVTVDQAAPPQTASSNAEATQGNEAPQATLPPVASTDSLPQTLPQTETANSELPSDVTPEQQK